MRPTRSPLLRVESPAKINLHLRVGAVRQDGFHPLHTWMVTVGLFDILNFLRDPTADEPVTLRCGDPAVPLGEANLVVRAGRLLQRESGDLVPADHVVIDLAKTIPMGGGLGGGSSNAAAALRVLNDWWDVDLPPDRLADFAAKLGSDVPFFLRGPSAICTGRGDLIVPVPPPACRWAVLMFPQFPISTAAAYRRLDELRGSEFSELPESDDVSGWSTLDAINLLPRLTNDLEAAAFDLQPALGDLRAAAEQTVARPVRMSGSGSTLFTLFDTSSGADEAAEEIQKRLSLKTIAVRVAP